MSTKLCYVVIKRVRKFPADEAFRTKKLPLLIFNYIKCFHCCTTSHLRDFPFFSFYYDKTSTPLSLPCSYPLHPLRPNSALPIHGATSAKIAELEKQGDKTRIGSWSNILL